MSLTNGLVIRQISENTGLLRLSRRRRGLPPDTSPTPLNWVTLDNNSSKRCKTLRYNLGDVPLASDCCISKMPQKEADCDKDITDENVSHMDEITSSNDEELKQNSFGHVGKIRLETASSIIEDLQDSVNVGKINLAKVTALESSEDVAEFTNIITNYTVSPVSKIICRQVREKKLQRNQCASSTVPEPISINTDSRTFARGSTVRTVVTKTAVNSMTSTHTHTDLIASYSAKHTAKSTSKITRKAPNTECTSPASSCSNHSPKSAAKHSSKGTTEDPSKDTAPVSSFSRALRGSTKGLIQTKTATSSIKTRTSPRILLKH